VTVYYYQILKPVQPPACPAAVACDQRKDPEIVLTTIMNRARLRHAWLLLLSVAAVAITGCRYHDTGDGRVIADRWVAATSSESFSLADVSREEILFDWRMSDADERDRWRTRFVDRRSRPVPGGLRVVPEGRRPSLDRQVELDAAEVDRIDVEIAGIRRGFVRLMWAGPGEPLDDERSIRVDAEAINGDVVRFELVEQPAWAGPIDRLRLVPTSVVQQTVVVGGVRGLHYRIDTDRLRSMVDDPLGLELDHELRTGVVLADGGEWRRTIAVPERGELEFLYGRQTRSAGAAIEVVVERDGRAGVVAASHALDARGVWQRGRVDLTPWSGATVDVAFRLTVPDPTADRREIAYVADPVVLRAADVDDLPPNVVVILIDTLRADRLSINGYARPTTPNLDRWAGERAINFAAAIAPAPWTLPSHVSLFTGLDAIVHGSNHTRGAPPGLDMLAERLRRAGYTTRAVTGGVFLHPRFGFDQGFDSFRYWPSDLDQGDEIADGTERALSVIDELADRPFFLFFHTYEVHKPYHEREPYFSAHFDGDASDLRLKVERAPSTEANGFIDQRSFWIADAAGEHELGAADQPYLDALYDGGVHFADAHVGRILDRIEALRSRRDTLVIVTSDHGEALGDRGLASHAYLWDFNLRIPLMVSLPDGGHAGRTVDRQVRLIDVLPTILDVAGIAPVGAVDGRSLVALCADPAAPFPDRAWAYAGSTNYGLALRVDSRLKYMVNDTIWQAVRGDEQLYHLDVDPAETNDLATTPSDELELVRRQAGARLGDAAAGLEISIANPTAAAASIRLAPVNPTRLKAVAVPQAVVVRHEPSAALIDMPPRCELTMRVESPDRQGTCRLDVADATGALVCGFDVEVAELGGGVRLCASAECCGEPVELGADGGITVGFLPLGVAGSDGGRDATPIDDELKSKLEALGYLHSD
jgi:arylsulfatase A-like enzyme